MKWCASILIVATFAFVAAGAVLAQDPEIGAGTSTNPNHPKVEPTNNTVRAGSANNPTDNDSNAKVETAPIATGFGNKAPGGGRAGKPSTGEEGTPPGGGFGQGVPGGGGFGGGGVG